MFRNFWGFLCSRHLCRPISRIFFKSPPFFIYRQSFLKQDQTRLIAMGKPDKPITIQTISSRQHPIQLLIQKLVQVQIIHDFFQGLAVVVGVFMRIVLQGQHSFLDQKTA